MDAAEDPICEHFQQAAGLIGKRWTPLVIRALEAGNARFSSLRDSVPGISDTVLSERLKELEAADVLTREVVPDTPVRIEYRLTERGRGLAKVMEALGSWAERWAEEPVG